MITPMETPAMRYERTFCPDCRRYATFEDGLCLGCDEQRNIKFRNAVDDLRARLKHERENRGRDLFEEAQQIVRLQNGYI